MRILRFRERDDETAPARLGVLLPEGGEGLLALDEIGVSVGLEAAIERADLAGLLSADPDLALTRQAVARVAPSGGAAAKRHAWVERRTTRTLAPLRPGKIIGVGLNYRDHVAEQGIEAPERPLLFAKFANALVGDGEPIARPRPSRALDFEAELAIVIGRRCQRLDIDAARGAIAGYTAADDVTARDLQGIKAALPEGGRGDGQWLRAKGSDGFCPLGPVFVSSDELPDPSDLAIRSWRTSAGPQGRPRVEAMQDGSTRDMIFGVQSLVAFISEVITLEPGDVILTGTPAGVGVFRDPPVFLEPGDVATIEVEHIGRLSSPIVDAEGRAPSGSPAARVLAGLHAKGAP